MIITGQFNDSLPPIMDGVAITASNYSYWLNRNHAPSFAIGPKFPNGPADDETTLRYHSLPSLVAAPYRLGFPRVDREFNRTIETIPFDLVHAHCPFVSGNYAYTLAKKRTIPLVATFHSKYRDDFASWMKLDATVEQALVMVVRFYEQADSVWVPNEAIIDTIREYGYKGPIEYIPNGSDIGIEGDRIPEELMREGREILGVDGGRPVFLYVGQHRWVKNLRLLVDGLRVAADQGCSFDMRFVGDGNDAHELKNHVKQRGLENLVKFLGPIRDRDKLRAAYAGTDLFLFPSLYDNASLATREAAGLLTPTLFVEGATTANGVVDGVNGFLAGNTAEEYGSKIQEILADSDIITRVGRGARDLLYRSWESIAATVYDKYSEIVDEFKWKQIRALRSSDHRSKQVRGNRDSDHEQKSRKQRRAGKPARTPRQSRPSLKRMRKQR